MIIFPAIDVLNNRAVRLLYGKRDEVTDYGSPTERAMMWKDQGAEYLHMVDLNGAFDNSCVNDKILKDVIRSIDIPVQIGGGIKTFDKVKYYLEEVGASRVIIGSALVTDPDTAEKAFNRYGNQIVAGIDAMAGFVRIKGWIEQAETTPVELALKMKAMGASTVVYTDISRDGALSGVNLKSTCELQIMTGMDIIASGGMSSIKDVESLAENNVYGAILGRSIYVGAINLADAIVTAKN